MKVSLRKLELQLTRIEEGVDKAMMEFKTQIADLRRLVDALKRRGEDAADGGEE